MELNDNNIFSTIEKVEKKLKELGNKQEKFYPVTNMSLELFGQRYNLHVVSPEQLYFLQAVLKSIYKQNENVSVGGYKVEGWLKDIQGRLDTTIIKDEIAKLNKTKDLLNNMYTSDMKNQLAFNDILQTLEL